MNNALVKHFIFIGSPMIPKRSKDRQVKQFLWPDKISHDLSVASEVKCRTKSETVCMVLRFWLLGF